jgi:hypothetical protein
MPGLLIALPVSGLVAWLGVWALVITVRQWTGRRPGRPLSGRMGARTLYGRMDTEARRAYDRGGLAFGFMLFFFAVFIADIGIAGPHLAEGSGCIVALSAIAGISFIGAMLSTVLFWSIKYFNRPKMLVPPRLRGEPGAIAGRRRRRERLGKPL